MHHWKADEIKFLYDCIGRSRENLRVEIANCYDGKRRRKKKKVRGHIRRGSVAYLKKQKESVRSSADQYDTLNKHKDVGSVADKVWAAFTAKMSAMDDDLGLGVQSVNEPQWNLALNDNAINTDPDVSFSMYITILDTFEKVNKGEKKKKVDMADEDAVLAMFAAKMQGLQLGDVSSVAPLKLDKKEEFFKTAADAIDPRAGLTEDELHIYNVKHASKTNGKYPPSTPLFCAYNRITFIKININVYLHRLHTLWGVRGDLGDFGNIWVSEKEVKNR